MIRQKFNRQKISIAGVLVARKNNRRHFKKLIAGTLTANKIWRALLRRKTNTQNFIAGAEKLHHWPSHRRKINRRARNTNRWRFNRQSRKLIPSP